VLTPTPRRDKVCGYSDHAYLVQWVTVERPEITLFLNGKKFLGLLDTGTNVSVTSSHHWPSTCPCIQVLADLQGVGSARAPLWSATIIKCYDEEGHSGFFTPYVLKHLPVNLWGRGVLQGMGAILCSLNSVVSHMML
jgi:hypothetical protein